MYLICFIQFRENVLRGPKAANYKEVFDMRYKMNLPDDEIGFNFVFGKRKVRTEI